MIVAITKLVTGEKNGKPWFLVHCVVPETGEALSKFVTSDTFKELKANDMPIEGLDTVDLVFDSRGSIVGVN